MSSDNKSQNQKEQNTVQSEPVKTQPSIEGQQEKEEELTLEELEKIAGALHRLGT
jgi:hypothetical protein